MTFYEAAVQVLRDAGRPLNAKKITLMAVDKGLLSHVGRSPEATMTARLEQESKKSDEDSAIQQVRPGVFGLREGIDLDAARQTIVLRTPTVTDEDEDEFEDDAAEEEASTNTEDDTSDEDGGNEDVAERDERDDEDGGRKRRRRGRRGGRSRNRNSADTEDAQSVDADERPEPKRSERRESKGGARRESRGDTSASPRNRKRRSERAADPARAAGAPTTFRPLSDITAAVAEILRDAKKLPLSASSVANELARAGVGALDKLGAAGLRDTLEYANARLARQGGRLSSTRQSRTSGRSRRPRETPSRAPMRPSSSGRPHTTTRSTTRSCDTSVSSTTPASARSSPCSSTASATRRCVGTRTATS